MVKTKKGYYTKMEMDMKTGKSKFIGFEKITFQDKVDSFVTNHQLLISFLSVISLLVASFLSTKSILLSSIPFLIGGIGLYLTIFRGGTIF